MFIFKIHILTCVLTVHTQLCWYYKQNPPSNVYEMQYKFLTLETNIIPQFPGQTSQHVSPYPWQFAPISLFTYYSVPSCFYTCTYTLSPRYSFRKPTLPSMCTSSINLMKYFRHLSRIITMTTTTTNNDNYHLHLLCNRHYVKHSAGIILSYPHDSLLKWRKQRFKNLLKFKKKKANAGVESELRFTSLRVSCSQSKEQISERNSRRRDFRQWTKLEVYRNNPGEKYRIISGNWEEGKMKKIFQW